MKLNRFEEFRQFLNTLVNYQIILPNSTAKPPYPCAILSIVNTDISVFNTPHVADDVQKTLLSVVALLQFDFYAKDQTEGQQMCTDMINKLIYINRKDLIRRGFGLKEISIDFQDLTFVENSKYIYRFSFDVNITWNEEVTRNVTTVESIDVNYENKEFERR